MEIIQVHHKIKQVYSHFLLVVFFGKFSFILCFRFQGVAQPWHTDTRIDGRHYSVQYRNN